MKPRVNIKYRPPARVFAWLAISFQDGTRGKRDALLERVGRDILREAARRHVTSDEFTLEGTGPLKRRALSLQAPHVGGVSWSYDGTELTIRGNLPESLKRCTFIQNLTMTNMNASDNDAEILSCLVQLRRLSMSASIIQPAASLARLPHLVFLSINARQLLAAAPYMSQLTQLRELNISGGSLPDAIGDLKNLRVLVAHYGSDSQLPDRITELSNLQRLDLGGCNIENLPVNMGRLQKLRSLSMCDCENLRSVPPSMGQCRSMRVIDLTGTLNLPIIPEEWSGMTRLRRLYFGPYVRTIPKPLVAQLQAHGQWLRYDMYWTEGEEDEEGGEGGGEGYGSDGSVEDDTLMTSTRRRTGSGAGAGGEEVVSDIRRWFTSEPGVRLKRTCGVQEEEEAVEEAKAV